MCNTLHSLVKRLFGFAFFFFNCVKFKRNVFIPKNRVLQEQDIYLEHKILSYHMLYWCLILTRLWYQALKVVVINI